MCLWTTAALCQLSRGFLGYLFRCSVLRLGAEILDRPKDDIRIRYGALEHVWLRNSEQDALALLDGHPAHPHHLLQPELGHGFTSLLLTPTLHTDTPTRNSQPQPTTGVTTLPAGIARFTENMNPPLIQMSTRYC